MGARLPAHSHFLPAGAQAYCNATRRNVAVIGLLFGAGLLPLCHGGCRVDWETLAVGLYIELLIPLASRWLQFPPASPPAHPVYDTVLWTGPISKFSLPLPSIFGFSQPIFTSPTAGKDTILWKTDSLWSNGLSLFQNFLLPSAFRFPYLIPFRRYHPAALCGIIEGGGGKWKSENSGGGQKISVEGGGGKIFCPPSLFLLFYFFSSSNPLHQSGKALLFGTNFPSPPWD